MHSQYLPDFGYSLSLHTEHIDPAQLPEAGPQDIGVLYGFRMSPPRRGQDRPRIEAAYLHTEGRMHHDDLLVAHELPVAHKAGYVSVDEHQRVVGANTMWSPRISQLLIRAWIGERDQNNVVRVNPSPNLLRIRAALLLTVARTSLQVIGEGARDAVINADMKYWYLRSPIGKIAFERFVQPDYLALHRWLLPDLER